jgi:hypothetical protein
VADETVLQDYASRSVVLIRCLCYRMNVDSIDTFAKTRAGSATDQPRDDCTLLKLRKGNEGS